MTIGDSLKTTGGHNVLIHCIADGTPKPSIMWEMNSVELKNSSRVYLYHNGTLGIEDIKQIDSGLYKCVALNSKGVDTSASRLVIRGKSPIKPFVCEIEQHDESLIFMSSQACDILMQFTLHF